MASYTSKVYRKQGGNEMVVASGGKITVESGGELNVAAGATLALGDGIAAVADIALARGFVVVGNTAGVGSALDANDSAKILIGDGTDLVSLAVTGDVTIGATAVTAIGAGKVTNAMVAPAALDGTVAKVVANANVIGGIPLTFQINITSGALGNTDVVMTHKVRVIDAYTILRAAGVANTTFQVFNGASAISSTMAASGADQAIVRATSIDDAAYEIAAAGTLRVTSATGATQPEATVYVTALRVA